MSGTLTFKFATLTGINQNALAVATDLNTDNPSITFNLGKGFGFVNGQLVLAPGASDQKTFAANATHEAMHVAFPNLTGKGTFHGSATPATTDLEKGQDAAGEYFFRLLTISSTQRIFGFGSPDEQNSLTLAKDELNANPLTKQSASGINWNSIPAAQVPTILSDKAGAITGFLPPAARTTAYDSGQMNDSDSLWQIEQNGNGVSITTTYDQFNTFSWDREIERIIENSPVNSITINDDTSVASATYAGAEIAGNIGAYFGSQLGQALGGNSVAGKLAAGTVLGAIGSEIGKALTMGASYSLELSVHNAFGALGGGTGTGSLAAGGIASVSSLLMGELAQKLNLQGVGGALFSAMGTTITSQLVTNAFNVMTGGTFIPVPGAAPVPYTLFTGFDPATMAGSMGPSVGLQLSGAVGGVLGSTLAAHIAVPQHAEGAVGQQIGSSIGGMVGASRRADRRRQIRGKIAARRCRSSFRRVAIPAYRRSQWNFSASSVDNRTEVGTRRNTRCHARGPDYRSRRGEFRRWKGLRGSADVSAHGALRCHLVSLQSRGHLRRHTDKAKHRRPIV